MTETIELIVRVKINYPEKSRRMEAIERAKECVLSTSILGEVVCTQKRVKFKLK
jgi:hypothetical protein